MSKSLRSVSASIGLVLVLCSIGSAQCFVGDDGFDVGCCNLANPVVPNFPALTLQADWAELLGCGPTNLNTVNMSLGAPFFVLCDYALIPVFVAFPSGETISGTLVAKYVRTWLPIPGTVIQAWRFLINGDLACAPNAAATPCTSQFPRCAFTGALVHFDGHLDYLCTQTTAGSAFTVSLSLTHHQGCLSHPWWSCVPLAGLLAHDESSYHLVGPSPFVFGPSPAPVGPLVGDSVRNSFLQTIPAFVYLCESEEKIGPLGSLTTTFNGGCLCGNFDQCTASPIPCPLASSCYEHQSLNFTTCCATGTGSGPHQNVPVGVVPLNQTGFLALKLGAWGALPQYPSGSSLTIYFGVVTYSSTPGCPQPNWPIHLVVGVATSTNFALPFTLTPACIPPVPSSSAFIDLQNVLPLTGGPLVPGYGCLAASDVVFSFNIP